MKFSDHTTMLKTLWRAYPALPQCLDHFFELRFTRRLNAELEERTASLIKEAEEVMVC